MINAKIGVKFIASAIALFAVVGCAHRRPDPAPPIDYAIFDTLNLNVASITVVDDTARQRVPGNISYRASVPLMMRVREMVAHRLKAAGSSGSAKVTVVQASIQHAPVSTLIGHLSLRVDVSSPSSETAGYAVIKTNNNAYTGKIDADSPEALDNMAISMMRSMNSALEYQVRHVLNDWLVDASGMPLRRDVKQTSLSSNTDNAAAVTTIDAGSSASPGITVIKTQVGSETSNTAPARKKTDLPDAIFPLGDDDTTSSSDSEKRASPPPGNLHLPARHHN